MNKTTAHALLALPAATVIVGCSMGTAAAHPLDGRIDSCVQQTKVTPLSRVSQGECVRVLQEGLTDLHYNPGPIDGRYGPDTENAVKRLQHDRNIAQDGLAGPLTFDSVKAGLAQQTPPPAPARPGAPNGHPVPY